METAQDEAGFLRQYENALEELQRISGALKLALKDVPKHFEDIQFELNDGRAWVLVKAIQGIHDVSHAFPYSGRGLETEKTRGGYRNTSSRVSRLYGARRA